MPTIRFLPTNREIAVPAGTVLSDAIDQAGLQVNLPCGGQGRCGRCKVRVESGSVRSRSITGLSQSEISQGFALACQTLVEDEDLLISIPPQDEMIVRRLPHDSHKAAKITLPGPCNWNEDPPIKRYFINVDPPSLADNTADYDRLVRTLRKRDESIQHVSMALPMLRRLANSLREANWQAMATVELHTWTSDGHRQPRLLDITPGPSFDPMYGIAIDIGTTSNVVYLVDLQEGQVLDTAIDYNGQISCGEDVISRIIFARRPGGLEQLQKLVVDTLNGLIAQLIERNKLRAADIIRACVAGNTTMIHLFLAMPPEPIRIEPYIPTIIHPVPVLAAELGLNINPDATVDCLPGVGSYVGADISAGVLACQMYRREELSLFIDVGTNGEMVLGNSDWLITCACSAGPAFEGAGVQSGMRATEGAIDEVWVDGRTGEPTYSTIGDTPALGLCGSGIICLLAELFMSGLLTKGGRYDNRTETARVRQGEHGMEYVVAWKEETARKEKDIVLTEVDVENLLRTKAAIYAGFATLTRSVGIDIHDVKHMLIGGSFGKYLNIEKSIQIGLLPDLPRERFAYLGNTSASGAFASLVCPTLRQEVIEIANKMTYLELSADNSFTEEFMSALFLPHTDMSAFPSVEEALALRQAG